LVRFADGFFAVTILDTSGNVGIGTSTPSSLLEICKNAGGGIGSILTLNNPGGSGNTAIYMNCYGVGTNDPTAAIKSLDNNWSSHITFSTKDPGAAGNALQERVRIQNDGKVGIGTTAPTYKLSVVDTSNEIQAIFGDGISSGTSQISIGLSGGTTDALFVGFNHDYGYGFMQVRGGGGGIVVSGVGKVGVNLPPPEVVA